MEPARINMTLLVFIVVFAVRARSQTQHSIGSLSETERCVCQPHVTINPPVCGRSIPVNSGTGCNSTTVQEILCTVSDNQGILRTVSDNHESVSSKLENTRRKVEELQVAVSGIQETVSSELQDMKRQLEMLQSSVTSIVGLLQACSIEGPLGMENRDIPDAAITASSFWDNSPTHAPQRSRLNTMGFCAAWAAGPGDDHPWIQVGFGDTVYITALITQGRGGTAYTQWVTAYNVMYGASVELAEYVTDVSGIPTEFIGNTDRNSLVRRRFETALVTRFLRILPLRKYSHFSMRFEIVGCRPMA